jgi:signal transduction histidine kinase
MFYIDAKIFKKRETLLLHIAPTVVVFTAFFAATILSWGAARENIKSEQVAILESQNHYIKEKLQKRMSAYEDILRGGVGLFRASNEVSSQEWLRYYESFDIDQRYPGIQGLGYTKMLAPEEKSQYEKTIQTQGIPNFKIYPNGERDVYSSITYIEPMNERNMKVLGYDMYQDPSRREAMLQSEKTNQPAITDAVTLIQESTDEPVQPGFLMYLPVKNGLSDTADGYVYAPFRTYDLISNTITDASDSYKFKITSSVGDQEKTLYESVDYQTMIDSSEQSSTQKELSLSMYGKPWKIIGVLSVQAVNESTRNSANSVLMSGITFSILVAALIYILIGNRSKALAQKEDQSIQSAKDELLALASHQLRTPATGVKQYIGMLREGFAGELTEAQTEIVERAYKSNERQLTTINEMLVVARADAGHLSVESKKFDLKRLMSEILEEHAPFIKSRKQRIHIKLPKRQVLIMGDESYLRMAIENVLSNASKYTRSGGKIWLSLTASDTTATLTIKDTGVGVAESSRHLLFKKFSRIPNDLTDQVVGSGIGLYLAKMVIESHDGEIEFESTEGQGSTVTINLPTDSKT